MVASSPASLRRSATHAAVSWMSDACSLRALTEGIRRKSKSSYRKRFISRSMYPRASDMGFLPRNGSGSLEWLGRGHQCTLGMNLFHPVLVGKGTGPVVAHRARRVGLPVSGNQLEPGSVKTNEGSRKGWMCGRESGAVIRWAPTRKGKSLQRGVRREIRTGETGHLSLIPNSTGCLRGGTR